MGKKSGRTKREQEEEEDRRDGEEDDASAKYKRSYVRRNIRMLSRQTQIT